MNSRRFIANPQSGDGILAAQTGTLIGAKPASRALPLDAANVADGSDSEVAMTSQRVRSTPE
jgi:hypothetical protein